MLNIKKAAANPQRNGFTAAFLVKTAWGRTQVDGYGRAH